MRAFTIAYGHFLFKHRNWILPLVSFTLLFALPPETKSAAMDLIGILMVVGGAAIRAAVVGLAYIRRGGIDKKVAADTLVTEGIFAHCRNPLYVGNLLIAFGFFVTHGNPVTMIAGGLFFLYAYHAIVAAEEEFLATKFGAAYAAYCAEVPRWAFKLRDLGETFRSMKFNWKRVVAKEYTTTFTWMLTLLGILAYEDYSIDGMVDYLVPFLTVLSAMIAAVLSVRYLKKSGQFSAA